MAGAPNKDLLRRLDAIGDLPSLPEVLLRVLELCDGENAEIKPIARLIETDAALSAKIIGVVNSLSYGLPNRVVGLEQAIVLLGTEAIKSIAICASLAGVFVSPARAGQAGARELRGVWRHSLQCALLARALARQASYLNPDDVFLAGLLHDIGKHVLLTLFPSEYPQCLARARANPDLLLVEEVRLGGLHSDLGAWLVRRWGLPGALAEPAESHHEPLHRILDASLLVRFVYGANLLTSAASERESAPEATVASLLGIEASSVADARHRAERELDDTARVLGIDLHGMGESAAQAGDGQTRLEREVRNISMLLASLWSITRASDEAMVLDTVFRTVAALFHADAALYFRFTAGTDTLACVAHSRRTSPEPIQGLLVNRTRSASAVAESSRSGSVRYAYGASSSVIDGQILRVLGTDGFVCYPLAARGEPAGVLVVGGADSKGEALRKKEKPMLLLAAEAALALQADRFRERTLEQARDERTAGAQILADRVVRDAHAPLVAIRSSVAAIAASGPGAEVCASLTSISEQVDRVEGLIGGLRRVSSPPKTELEELDVPAVVERLRPALERLAAGTKATVQLATASSLPRVRADADSIGQMLVGLVRNAVEAMPDGGTVEVRAEGDPADGGHAVRIVVEDAGPGVPDQVKDRLFEPFVTTKAHPHRGLGLSAAHAVVRGLGGSIRCEPARASRGARFVVSLPAI